jgi:Ca2+:H+ antiporter
MDGYSTGDALKFAPVRTILKPSLSWLMVFVPAAVAIRYVPALRNDIALFVCAGLAVIPLAGLMGRATEALGARFGPGVGGLLNATFGNAAELIIGLMALSRGLVDVVKASITGSIIGNSLLVLGGAILWGGLKYERQTFSQVAVRASTTSLMLAAVGLLIPSVFHATADDLPRGWSPQAEQELSLAIAVVLFGSYACTLLFSLATHRNLYSGGAEAGHEPEMGWSKGKATMVLLGATLLVAWMSEFLVATVETARERFGFTEVFVGVVVVAIIGNAAEHSTALLMARKNKMDLALGIAIGSSLQIALFVAPVLVFCSYAFGAPMNLEFTVPEIVAVLAAVFVFAQITGDGESNWLEGAQLLSLYLILAILFYYLPATR